MENENIEAELSAIVKPGKPIDARFHFLIQMDMLRQDDPAAYEKAKSRKVTIGFRGDAGLESNYCIDCVVEGIQGGMPMPWEIDGTPEEIDKALKQDVARLRTEGFTDIDYLGYVP